MFAIKQASAPCFALLLAALVLALSIASTNAAVPLPTSAKPASPEKNFAVRCENPGPTSI
ncbi:hypothetical protein T484DRAFT_1909026 [Baffinella frigidus]|nr:hypothetical protein T484DRAFT_1909026 [Cryptophyta sp. CCMP2293]